MLKPLSFNGKALVRTIDSDGYTIPHEFRISWTPTYYDSPSSIEPVYFNVATVYFANGQSKTFKSNQGPITHVNTVEAYGSEITSIDFLDSQYLDTIDFVSNYYVTPTESLLSGTKTLRTFYGNMSMSGNTSAKNMFSNCYNLGGTTTSQGVSGLKDCSGLTTLEGMFSDCYKYYDSSSSPSHHEFYFNTVFDSLESVTSMKSMFSGCTHLGQVTLRKSDGLDTPNLTDTSYMFYGTDLGDIDSDHGSSSSDLSGLNMSNVTDTSYMFGSCNTRVWLDIKWDTHNVRNAQGMFAGSSITVYGTSNFSYCDFSSVTNMSRYLSSCTSLIYPTLRHFENGDSLVDVSYMFNNCTRMTSVVPGFVGASITNMSYMFNGCSALTYIDFSRLSLTGTPTMTDMFKGCSSLEQILLPRNVTTNTLNLIKGRVQTDVGGTWTATTGSSFTYLNKE